LLSLATNTPKHYEIKILDPHSENWSIDRTIEKINSEKPDILGISAVTSKAYQMMKVLNSVSVPYKVVGGPHTTHYSEQILRQGADAAFIGQLADLEFAKAVEERPRGIIKCSTGINDIQFPDRSFLDAKSYYGSGNLFVANKRMSMFSGIGCPNRCNFCDVQTKKVQRKNPKEVIREMIYLQGLGAKSIHIYEDNFNTDERYLENLCKEMDDAKFEGEWSGRGQAIMSLDSAKMLADRGFKRIHVGIESLSDKTLKFFGKNLNYNKISRFCDTMNKVGIDMISFFIIGVPTETKEDRKTMAKRIKDLGIKHPLFSILQPLPNTRYYQDLINNGIYTQDYWSNYINNPIPDFMIPFPYGKQKWEEDAQLVEELIEQFKEHD
jgi:radical SAM superfamily enzyme YgiQ (UPF0313 family)